MFNLASQLEEVARVFDETELTVGDRKGKHNIVRDPIVVKTKGGAAAGMKEAKERRCSQCKMVGHTKRTCVKKVADDNCGDFNTSNSVALNDNASEIGWELSRTVDFIEHELMHTGGWESVYNDQTSQGTFQTYPSIDNAAKDESWGRWWWGGWWWGGYW